MRKLRTADGETIINGMFLWYIHTKDGGRSWQVSAGTRVMSVGPGGVIMADDAHTVHCPHMGDNRLYADHAKATAEAMRRIQKACTAPDVPAVEQLAAFDSRWRDWQDKQKTFAAEAAYIAGLQIRAQEKLYQTEPKPVTYERFTDRARKVMVLAKRTAQRLSSATVGPVHILAGIMEENYGVAANVLKNLDVNMASLYLVIEKALVDYPCASGNVEPGVPDLPELHYACEAAKGLGHSYIGTEHLLLGLIHPAVDSNTACAVLRDLGVTTDNVKKEVELLLGTGGKPTAGQVVEDEVATEDLRLRAVGEYLRLSVGVVRELHDKLPAEHREAFLRVTAAVYEWPDSRLGNILRLASCPK